MTGVALERPRTAVALELRAAWATGRRVSVRVERADLDRVEGVVERVSATGATARISGTLVPLGHVLSVHLPSRLGDSTARGAEFHGGRPVALHVISGQTEIPLP